MANQHHDSSYLDNLLTYGLDPRRRTIVFHGDMEHREDRPGQGPVQEVVRALMYLDSTPGDINLWVSTSGGLEFESFGLYDIIRTRVNRVITTGFGVVASAGVLVLVAGDVRRCTTNCWLMSHAATAGVDEKADLPLAMQALAQTQRMHQRWAELMGRHTKPTARWWASVHFGRTRELWLDAQGMLDRKVVDEIVGEA